MKNSVFSIVLILIGIVVSCQNETKSKSLNTKEEDVSKDTDYSPEVEHKIQLSIAQQVKQLKLKLQKESISKQRIQFMMDTFQIVAFRSRKMDYFISTGDMNQIVSEEIVKYDRLMNIYYKQLYAKLDASDQEILQTAQKAWLEYRDKELALCSTLRNEKYSGGGTIQSNIFTSLKCNLTRQRMNELFEHTCFE